MSADTRIPLAWLVELDYVDGDDCAIYCISMSY